MFDAAIAAAVVTGATNEHDILLRLTIEVEVDAQQKARRDAAAPQPTHNAFQIELRRK